MDEHTCEARLQPHIKRKCGKETGNIGCEGAVRVVAPVGEHAAMVALHAGKLGGPHGTRNIQINVIERLREKIRVNPCWAAHAPLVAEGTCKYY